MLALFLIVSENSQCIIAGTLNRKLANIEPLTESIGQF
ncbi:hypothetical protein EcWSU1_02434 [Enterobacter ludwigii]|uniref:Uncharacterized protein n=1 Tax=Enterobacter ludwigii TaxID=299767 RepID=G8LD46_9ENTR|nr:hypothetical protein EcWSU1_02434 [Enterobacter ludwigii]